MTDFNANRDASFGTAQSNTSPAVTYPTMQGNGAVSSGSASNAAEQAKNALVDNASSAYNSLANSEIAQNTKQTVVNGPVADSVRTGYADTKADFSGLANSANQRPAEKLATGQQRTTYHSFFYNLLTWKHPRATLITFALSVAFIFSARYLNVLRYLFKAGWTLFGVTALAELAGKPFSDKGFASQARPKKYYVLPKESVDRIFGECHELLNFFVLEFQRIVFVENIFHTILAFVASLVGYFAIKIVPVWGLCLISTVVAYLAPLIYIKNQDLIDNQVANAQHVITKQATQVKDVAAKNTGQYAETAKQYAGDYSHKLQSYVGNARGRTGSPLDSSDSTTRSSNGPASSGSMNSGSMQSGQNNATSSSSVSSRTGLSSTGLADNGSSNYNSANYGSMGNGVSGTDSTNQTSGNYGSTGNGLSGTGFTNQNSANYGSAIKRTDASFNDPSAPRPASDFTESSFPVAPRAEPAMSNDLLPEIQRDSKPLPSF